jgi:hypothetical protein
MRRVNDKSKAYWNKAFTLDYDKANDVLGDTPKPFRYKNLRKGDVVGSQLLAGWVMSDGSKMVSTDSQRIKERGENIRGDKYLESSFKIDILVTQIPVELENGIYDPIFGLKFDGEPEDARSVSFVDLNPSTDYQFNLLGVDANDGVINVLQFDENDETTAAVDLVEYNQTLTTQIDTVKVKVWASDILVDSSDVPITDYRIAEQQEEYNAISEVIEYEVMEDPDQLVGAIRQRKNRDITIMKLS